MVTHFLNIESKGVIHHFANRTLFKRFSGVLKDCDAASSNKIGISDVETFQSEKAKQALHAM
jgi:hypothetical protein